MVVVSLISSLSGSNLCVRLVDNMLKVILLGTRDLRLLLELRAQVPQFVVARTRNLRTIPTTRNPVPVPVRPLSDLDRMVAHVVITRLRLLPSAE